MGEEILEFLSLGLVLGGIYALFAVGLTLIFGVLDIVNVAHGEFFAIGGYALYIAMVVLGLHPAVGLVLSTAVVFAFGLGVYPLLLAPLKKRLGRRNPGPLFLVLTLGLSALMQNSLLAAGGGEYLKVAPAVQGGLGLCF